MNVLQNRHKKCITITPSDSVLKSRKAYLQLAAMCMLDSQKEKIYGAKQSLLRAL